MDARFVELSGRVSRRTFDVGSKSERESVALETDSGEVYAIRKDGAPAFGDHSLDALVGGNFTMRGIANGRLLIVRDWSPHS